MRCRVINVCYLFITYNLVSGSGTGARNTDVTARETVSDNQGRLSLSTDGAIAPWPIFF